jgi:ssDNA-binding Zn-finger/Zn-ribbon topoisomerase 1
MAHSRDDVKKIYSSPAMGFWQYQRRKNNIECPLSRPFLMREESQKGNIVGFYGDLTCPHCHEQFNFILIDFEKPIQNCASKWNEIICNEMDEDILRCPNCGYRELVLEPA